MRIPLAAVLAMTLAAPACAEPCQWGTNRPGSDVNPARRIDESAPQMRCSMTVTERTDAQGNVRQTRTWNFAVGPR